MTAASQERPAAPPRRRWLRIAAIAVAAVSLASCRALPPAALIGTAAVSHAIPQADPNGPAFADPAQVDAAPFAASPDATSAAAVMIESSAATPEDEWQAEVRRASPAAVNDGSRVMRTGLEAPCPPLPRIQDPAITLAGCRGGACGPSPCGTVASGLASCGPAPCGPCVAFEGLPPIVSPCLVCDGGDHNAPAAPVGESGLKHLTAGDTVARFRPDDHMPDAADVRIVASNCACVFAPRFAAVREVTRPAQDAVPEGPRGLSLPTGPELQSRGEPVCGKVQTTSLVSSRVALPGVAVEERLGPLAVDQGEVPSENEGRQGPNERVLDERLDLERLRQQPLIKVGFDVPVAWTCIKAANVLLGDQSAQVVAADRGTATLRFEEPGRAELTLCKRSGTDTARQGEELDFTIYMLNSGDRPLTGIVLADALPSRLVYVPDSAAANLPAEFATQTGDDGSVVLTWRLEKTLRPGESGFVRFRTVVK
jgi:uncharacterized repeat protein (TIGR01451 family)